MSVMNPELTMGLIVAVPTLLIILTRSKAALVFMALCVGSVLSVLVGDTALDMVQLFVRDYSVTTQAGVQLGLLLAPALLTLLFLNRSVKGSKWILNIFPALLTGIATLYLVVPLLTEGAKFAIYDTQAWTELYQYQAILISAAALSSLVQLWAGGKAARHKRHGKK